MTAQQFGGTFNEPQQQHQHQQQQPAQTQNGAAKAKHDISVDYPLDPITGAVLIDEATVGERIARLASVSPVIAAAVMNFTGFNTSTSKRRLTTSKHTKTPLPVNIQRSIRELWSTPSLRAPSETLHVLNIAERFAFRGSPAVFAPAITETLKKRGHVGRRQAENALVTLDPANRSIGAYTVTVKGKPSVRADVVPADSCPPGTDADIIKQKGARMPTIMLPALRACIVKITGSEDPKYNDTKSALFSKVKSVIHLEVGINPSEELLADSTKNIFAAQSLFVSPFIHMGAILMAEDMISALSEGKGELDPRYAFIRPEESDPLSSRLVITTDTYVKGFGRRNIKSRMTPKERIAVIKSTAAHLPPMEPVVEKLQKILGIRARIESGGDKTVPLTVGEWEKTMLEHAKEDEEEYAKAVAENDKKPKAQKKYMSGCKYETTHLQLDNFLQLHTKAFSAAHPDNRSIPKDAPRLAWPPFGGITAEDLNNNPQLRDSLAALYGYHRNLLTIKTTESDAHTFPADMDELNDIVASNDAARLEEYREAFAKKVQSLHIKARTKTQGRDQTSLHQQVLLPNDYVSLAAKFKAYLSSGNPVTKCEAGSLSVQPIFYVAQTSPYRGTADATDGATAGGDDGAAVDGESDELGDYDMYKAVEEDNDARTDVNVAIPSAETGIRTRYKSTVWPGLAIPGDFERAVFALPHLSEDFKRDFLEEETFEALNAEAAAANEKKRAAEESAAGDDSDAKKPKIPPKPRQEPKAETKEDAGNDSSESGGDDDDDDDTHMEESQLP